MHKKSLERPSLAEYSVGEEQILFSEALAAKNFKVAPAFLNSFKVGDIIELYEMPENTQVYCNREFLKLCSYSREQMSTIPYPKLFWRDEDANIALMHRASYVFTHESGCVYWDIANHDLVESLHPRKRTFEMKMGVIAPVFSIKDNERRGWASTLQVSLIFEWPEAI